MSSLPARVAALVLLAVTASGCSTVAGWFNGPAGDVALEWAEHVCEGRYGQAHDLTATESQIDAEVYPEVADFLAEAESLAGDRLEALAAEGTDVAPDLGVDDVRDESTPVAVYLTGSCWGEQFSETVEVVEQDGEWRVARSLPVWNSPVLFDFPGYNTFAQLEIAHGVSVQHADSGNDLWLLLPGQHAVEVPAHFLTGDALATELTITGLRLTERGTLPEISTERIADAFTDLVTECGDLCVLTLSPDEDRVPVTPVTIEPVTDTEVTVSADTVLVRPTGEPPGFTDARPESWGRDSSDTGLALLAEVALEYTHLSCPGAEPCTVTVADEVDGLIPVHGLVFVEAENEVAVSGLL